MNRLIENELQIKLIKTESVTVGVDTPEDLLLVEELMNEDIFFPKYK